jgi:hypothetical protein
MIVSVIAAPCFPEEMKHTQKKRSSQGLDFAIQIIYVNFAHYLNPIN